jgi:aminoglycoside phosphotransferase family enzyme/predicted kinase
MTIHCDAKDPALEQAAVLAFLQQAEPGVQRVDTHASIVFLGRDRVLKIKRAVRLPFLDYSTLARRRLACEQELEINKLFAPKIYRRVLPITRDVQGLAIDGSGNAVEWAVEMARFDETQGFDHLAARRDIPSTMANALADVIAAAHDRQPPLRTSGWVASIAGIIDRNTERFRSIEGIKASDVDRLDATSHAALLDHQRLLADRGGAGFVRRCHGDLHLGNIVLIDGQPVLFDAIEFDPAIATTDILYDLAFPLMDLVGYGCAAAANALFNRYMDNSADANLDALALLPLFLSMRAAIRANVLFTKSEQSENNPSASWEEARRYFDLAVELISPASPRMVAIGGLSGTGKSELARAMAPRLGPVPGALVLRSDVVRKKLFGLSETARLPEAAYAPEVTARVYAELLDGATRVARQNHSVILDAAFLRESERASFSAIAPSAIPHDAVFLKADRAVRIARIETRRNDASDATAAVTIQQESMLLGTLTWPSIDAGGSPEQTLDEACSRMAIDGRPIGRQA